MDIEKGKIVNIIEKMLIRIAKDDWDIRPACTYEDWVKHKKRYVQYAEREIFKLIHSKEE